MLNVFLLISVCCIFSHLSQMFSYCCVCYFQPFIPSVLLDREADAIQQDGAGGINNVAMSYGSTDTPASDMATPDSQGLVQGNEGYVP